MDFKSLILENLEILRKREVISNQPFKVRAYETVINQIKEKKTPILSWDDLEGITGIGKKIRAKIDEIFQTGKLESARRAIEEGPLAIYDQFLQIYGVGPAKAKELVDAGFTSIPQLRDAVKKNPSLLKASSKIGLEHFEDFQERIPRSEMEIHDKVIHTLLPPRMKAELVGSYRRGASDSGDIDVLIQIQQKTVKKQIEEFREFIFFLLDTKYLTDVLALGEMKCLGVCRVKEKYRRIDFLLTPEDEFPFALLYFTGSKQFNIAMRRYAQEEMNLSLNEYGFQTSHGWEANIEIKSEEDIFEELGLQYIIPSERIDERAIIPKKKLKK